VTIPWEEHRLFNGFLDSNAGKLQLKTEGSGRLSTGRTDENVEKVVKFVKQRLTKYHFGDRLEVKPANSNGGLEQVTGLLKVCASVAHC
jgi:hypothetical protein